LSATELMIKVSVWILPLLLAITLHEAAHGYAAWKLGDDTAYRLGRVTFNPLRHIDLFGTLLMPAFLLLGSGGRVMFGFAKPVPVNFHRLRNPRGDMVLVALAGPGTNLALAFVSAVLFHTVQFMPPVVDSWLFNNLYSTAGRRAGRRWAVAGQPGVTAGAHGTLRGVHRVGGDFPVAVGW
jgi:Zn-dependent protease